jgi:hypothetical protein
MKSDTPRMLGPSVVSKDEKKKAYDTSMRIAEILMVLKQNSISLESIPSAQTRSNKLTLLIQRAKDERANTSATSQKTPTTYCPVDTEHDEVIFHSVESAITFPRMRPPCQEY